MKNKRTRERMCAIIAAAMLGVGVSVEASKVGLSSQFVSVVLEGLQVGRNYNLLELRGVPYTVKNRGDGPANIVIDIEQPDPKNLLPGYEPIPELNWLSVTPNEMRINPGDSGFAALTINIPKGEQYIGRHYHGVVWAHIKTTGWFSAGVRSNIRFSTGKSPETLQEEEKYRSMVALNYDMWPSALYLKKAAVGKYESEAGEKKSFLFTNRDEEPIELVITPVPWARPTLPPGYEKVNDLGWVRFEPSTIKADGLSIEKVKLVMDIPEQYAGKKIAFMARLSLPIGTIVNMTHRVLVEVAPKDGAVKTEEKK
ncbi:MAG: hypothetical protein COX66_10130 [Elusimicrobia bacterium CG_4_10_14_0_2_um_filter_63_34]|nr:MAG: hypothetical protein COX66_10130 [Elusimicrobia bacterium CG_4_10_14_0_2_um_filter_63_34]